MRYYYAVLITALCALCVWGGLGLTHHVIVAVDKWGNAAPDLKPTLDAINRPCGQGKPCGLLANANKTVIKVGDAIVTTQMQERAIAPHTVAAMDTLNAAAQKLGKTADSISVTAGAATGSLDALTDTLGEGKRTIAAAQPLLVAYTKSGQDLDALLKSKAVYDTLDATSATTEHIAGVTGDLQSVSDDMRKRYFAPVPWWKKIAGGAEFTIKAGNKALGWW